MPVPITKWDPFTPPLIRWEPFAEIERFLGEEFPRAAPLRISWDLAVDLYEEGNNVIEEMNLPGIDPEKIDITVEGEYLRVAGKREEEKEIKKRDYYSREIKKGAFERLVRLPEAVRGGEARAEYRGGVLTVTIPKKEPVAAAKKVKVAVK